MLNMRIAPQATTRGGFEFVPPPTLQRLEAASSRSPSHGLSGRSSISEHGVTLATPMNGSMTVLPDARTTTHAH